MMTNRKTWVKIGVGSVVCVTLIAVLLPLTVWAGEPDLPPRPIPDLPPRPRPKPESPPASMGGLIELYVRFDPTQAQEAAYWRTDVQWQDGFGEWHPVDSWWGTLDKIHHDWGRKSWWLGEEHFGTGPFRWVVYDAQDDELLGQSESFYMPLGPGQVVRTWVTIDISGNDGNGA